MHIYGIDTQRRAEMFIAQLAHESCEFSLSEEIASGKAYEWRMDLGNNMPGDGERFKGRGFIQITGRANYYLVSKALGKNFLAKPSDLSQAPWNSLASAWWWRNAGLNAITDKAGLEAVTRRINGGTNGLKDRAKYLRRARLVRRWLVPRATN